MRTILRILKGILMVVMVLMMAGGLLGVYALGHIVTMYTPIRSDQLAVISVTVASSDIKMDTQTIVPREYLAEFKSTTALASPDALVPLKNGDAVKVYISHLDEKMLDKVKGISPTRAPNDPTPIRPYPVTAYGIELATGEKLVDPDASMVRRQPLEGSITRPFNVALGMIYISAAYFIGLIALFFIRRRHNS